MAVKSVLYVDRKHELWKETTQKHLKHNKRHSQTICWILIKGSCTQLRIENVPVTNVVGGIEKCKARAGGKDERLS